MNNEKKKWMHPKKYFFKCTFLIIPVAWLITHYAHSSDEHMYNKWFYDATIDKKISPRKT